jgi:DNA-binding MarR family transcriptional regulator
VGDIIGMRAKLDLSDCPDCLCLASRRAARGITRAFDWSLRPHGLRVTQFTILVMLMLRGPARIGDLAERLGIERTTLSRNLARVEALSWVRIRPARDRRSRTVSVTAKGRVVVAASIDTWRKAQKSVAAAIGPAGVKALGTLSRSKLR